MGNGADNLLTVAAAFAAVALGIAAQALIWGLLRRGAARFIYASQLLKQTSEPARYLLPLIALQFVWLSAPPWEFLPLLVHISRVLLVAALAWLAVRAVSAITDGIVASQPITAADNLGARRVHTQAVLISRCVKVLIVILGIALALMTFPGARSIGASLLASAGLAGIVAGVAARPVLSNLIAGMQIALAQPFRIDDVLIVEGEWGRVEEITATYVSLKIWDERRLVIPLQWFIENPFQNWTRSTSQLIGSVIWWVDFRMPLEPLREELQRVCESSEEWDGRLNLIQVTELSDRAMQIRALVTARSSGETWDLRCKVREALVDFMQEHYPDYLPRQRNDLHTQNAPVEQKRREPAPAEQ